MINATPLTLRKRAGLELWRQRERLLARQHPLQQLFWECTLRCNLHCRHCGSDCKVTAGQQDMPKEDFMRALDSIAAKTDPHQVFVILSGGEPLMRDDLEDCGRAIYERGFPWGMVSNGLVLDEQRLHALLRAGMHAVTLSLDGLEAEHNWMRGHRDSFERVDRAIRLIVRENQKRSEKNRSVLSFDVVTCVNCRNYAQLPAIRDYLVERGVEHWRLFTVFPVGRAATDPDMRLTDEEFRGVFRFIRETRQHGHIHASYGCEGFLGNWESEVRDHLFSCQAGITIGSVLVDGSISACTSIRSDYHQGNIYRDDFMDVWEQRFQPYRHHEWMRKGECANCHLFRYCQGNGMHLRDGEGNLLLCHIHRLQTTRH